MKITRQQRYEYRDLLIEKGVPEEIAVIASERIKHANFYSSDRACDLIDSFFLWEDTPEGHDLWAGVAHEAKETCK